MPSAGQKWYIMCIVTIMRKILGLISWIRRRRVFERKFFLAIKFEKIENPDFW